MLKKECLFCKMIKGDIPVDKVYETVDILAFRDIAPKAPQHILLIPKVHMETVHEVDTHDEPYMTLLSEAANRIADQEGFADAGYRLVVNCRDDGGQEVYHLHMHLLAGKTLDGFC